MNGKRIHSNLLGLLVLSLFTFHFSPSYALSPTRTLPIVYVNTQNQQDVTDTETQIPATVYIDSVLPEYRTLGSAAAPIAATIKGRGNWTWTGFDKRPYKLKFDVKQKVLGMPNNRHWCLLACADDYLGFLKNPAGFMLSEAMGLRWTPRQVPVELVLNGQYLGLYFLTEHVRIAKNRVHIIEQADNGTHPDSITGGWLVEIDNYWSDGNVVMNEPGMSEQLKITIKEPESLSSAQRTYIESQLNALNSALYETPTTNDELLTTLLDFDEAAKYYLVQEIMEDCESYHGSCFLYKDRDSLGVADRWKFGPVWDFGNAYDRYKYNYMEEFIYVRPSFAQHWIGQLAQWPAFQQKVQENWYVFLHQHKDSVRAHIGAYAARLTQAAKNDAELWRNSRNYCSGQGDNADMNEKLAKFYRRYDWRIDWLYSQWGEGLKPSTEALDQVLSNDKRPTTNNQKVLLDGRLLIIRDGNVYDVVGKTIIIMK